MIAYDKKFITQKYLGNMLKHAFLPGDCFLMFPKHIVQYWL